jgi:glycosyltransferase involved in cell wall biosynthesis
MTTSPGRLLLVVPSATSFATFFRGIANEWRQRGGDVAVATGPDLPGHGCSQWPASVERLDLPVTRLASPIGVARAVRSLRRYVAAWQPDIVHAHFAAAAVVAAATRASLWGINAEWIATFHGMHMTTASTWGSRLLAAAEVWAARRMSVVCVLNREDRELLRQRLPNARVYLHESYGVGCDLEVFDPQRISTAQRDAVRSRMGIPADAFVVAYVGRQVDFKGFPVAVRGYQAARAAGLKGWLLLVGESDSAHRSGLSGSELRAVAADPGIVRTGWQADVAPYLAAADVSILPSLREGMPVSAMESLALGTPVITVNARGCRDVVRDRVDGIVLGEPTPQRLAAALLECAADHRLLDDFRTAAIAGRNRFDRRRYTEEQVGLYLKRVPLGGIQEGRNG